MSDAVLSNGQQVSSGWGSVPDPVEAKPELRVNDGLNAYRDLVTRQVSMNEHYAYTTPVVQVAYETNKAKLDEATMIGGYKALLAIRMHSDGISFPQMAAALSVPLYDFKRWWDDTVDAADADRAYECHAENRLAMAEALNVLSEVGDRFEGDQIKRHLELQRWMAERISKRHSPKGVQQPTLPKFSIHLTSPGEVALTIDATPGDEIDGFEEADTIADVIGTLGGT